MTQSVIHQKNILRYNDFDAAYDIEEKIGQQFPEQTPRYDE